MNKFKSDNSKKIVNEKDVLFLHIWIKFKGEIVQEQMIGFGSAALEKCPFTTITFCIKEARMKTKDVLKSS